MSLRWLLIRSIAWVLCLAVLPRGVWCAEGGAEATPGKAADVLRFRRVYAPADRPQDWPRGGVKYLPIEPAEFERLLQIARTATAEARVSAAARPVTAQYQARLVGDRLAEGQATFQVIHSAEGPALLPLDPCSLAIGQASWAPIGSLWEATPSAIEPSNGEPPGNEPPGNEPPGFASPTESPPTTRNELPGNASPGNASPTESPPTTREGPPRATLGRTVDGKLALLVQRSGQLHFAWSLVGRRDAAEALSFQLELPPCPNNRLVLDVPENLTPVVDDGVVTEVGPFAGDPSAGNGADERFRRWQIELGGRHRVALRIVPAGAAARVGREAGPLVRESLQYHFSPRGLTLKARLELEVHGEPLREVTLAVDHPLQLVNAPGTLSVTTTNGNRVSRVVLTLPEPIRESPYVLKLEALAPLVTDRPWRLPRIRVEKMFWQEGRAALFVPAPLLAKQVEPIGCRQTGTSPLPDPAVGEWLQFQSFSPDARIRLLLGHHQAPVKVATGTAVVLGSREMTAEVRADFRTADARRFVLEADVARQWLIDSVETLPPDALDDWQAQRRGGGRRQLTIRLAKALSPNRPVRLLIAARRLLSPLGRELGVGDLAPLRFTAPAEGKRLMAVDAVSPYRLKLTAAERLHRVHPRSLDAAELELFAELPRNLLFENEASSADLRISLEAEKPGYRGEIEVEAVVGHGRLRESYLLSCTPESTRVDRVLVHFFPRRDVPLRWTLDEEVQQLSARPLSIDEQAAAGLAPEGETWELTLRRPRSQPFEIRVVRQVKLAAKPDTVQQPPRPVSLCLVSLPEASSQRGTLVLRSLGPETVRITNSRLKPIPVEVPQDGYQTARAAYRYDPPSECMEAAESAVTVSATQRGATPPAWVWSCRLESRYQSSGTGRHRATYRLQNSGSGSIRLAFPAEASPDDVRAVWIGVNRAVWRRLDGGLQIDLPPREKFPTVSVDFTTTATRWGIVGSLEYLLNRCGFHSIEPQTRLGMVGSLYPPWPEADLPILSRHWTVWLPPGYEAFDPELRRQLGRTPRWSFSRRLFGPLGRAADQAPFDPLVAKHWSAMAGPAGHQPADTSDWTVYRLECPGRETSRHTEGAGPPVRLKFVHRRTMRLLGSVSFLLMLGLGWWKLSGRPVVLTLLLGVFGLAALVLSEAYVPIASGGVLAMLFCLVLRLIRRPHGTPPPPDEEDRPLAPHQPPSTVTMARIGVVALVATAIVAMGVAARGAEPAGNSPPTPTPLHRVFIPVDSQQQPTGGKFYVPQELYDRLHRRAAAAAARPQGWLISGATYRGVLVPGNGSDRLRVEELSAVFDLQVFSQTARVEIPLLLKEANLVPDGALLDGRVIQPEWETNHGGLTLEIPQPGEHRLELALRPASVGDGGQLPDTWGGFDLSIPRLATARLELTLPADAPPIDVPSALGSIRRQRDPPRLIAELGPADRLTVRWRKDAGAGGIDPALDVEELIWLRVLPGSVVVDARLKFKLIEGRPGQLRLATDPRLRPDRIEVDGQPVEKPRTAAGRPQIITLPWPRPEAREVVVDATFLLTGASGVGNLLLPELRALDARPTRRWLAVSVDPALEYESRPPKIGNGQPFEAVALPDFLGAWGVTGGQPLFAYRLPLGPTDFPLRVWPSKPVTTVEQILALNFDRDSSNFYSAEIRFDAELLTTAGYNFRYRLTVPAALQLDHVSVLEEGVERAARFSRLRKDAVTVFLNGPAGGRQKLSLRGRLPAAGRSAAGKQRNLPLPVIHIDGCTQVSSEFQLFRRPGVLVQLDQAEGLVAVEDPIAEPGSVESGGVESDGVPWGRLVGRFRAEGQRPVKALLTLRPNRPIVEAVQLIRLRGDGPSLWEATPSATDRSGRSIADGVASRRLWTAEFECHIRVSGGVVDELRLDAPEPFDVERAKVSPPATLKIDRQTRQLIVRPAEAIDADYRFKLSAPLALEPGQRPAVPAIELKQAGQLERIVCLPRQAQGRAVDWQTRNLQQIDLPDDLAAPADGDSFVTYQVIGEPWRAIVGPPEQVRRTAQVHLADVCLAWTADGACRGVATFDLQPGKSSHCPLWLPEGTTLVKVFVAGVPTEPEAIPVVGGDSVGDASRWRLTLGPARLPQRIEVVFIGVLSESAGAADKRFEAPTLGNLPVGKTLWTVAGPSQFTAGQPQQDAASDAVQQDWIRLKNAAARIESASMVSTEDPQETTRWYLRWARRLAAARAALRHEPARSALTDQQRALIEFDRSGPTDLIP